MPILMQLRFQSRQAMSAPSLRLCAVHNFLAQGPVSWKTIFPCMGVRAWFQDDSSTLHLLHILFLSLYQLHLRSSGIRSQRLETPPLENRSRRALFLSRWALFHTCRTGCSWSNDPKERGWRNKEKDQWQVLCHLPDVHLLSFQRLCLFTRLQPLQTTGRHCWGWLWRYRHSFRGLVTEVKVRTLDWTSWSVLATSWVTCSSLLIGSQRSVV